MSFPRRIMLALSVVAFGSTPKHLDAQNRYSDAFIDPEDGMFDVSTWLEQGGFFPVPIIITEPAVENGLGFAPAWIYGGDRAKGIPPNTTGFFALTTGNESEAYGGFHEGYYFDDTLRVSSVVAKASLNLDFFAGDNPTGFPYNLDGRFTVNSVRWRMNHTPWFVGGRFVYGDLDVSLGQGGTPPGGLPPLGFGARLSGLGAVIDYESLDNTFTPTDGTSARFAFTRFDEAIGSGFDYTEVTASAFNWWSPSDGLTWGAKIEAAGVTDGAPFFLQPDVTLRGIPAARYQNQQTFATEGEVTYRLNPRWGVAGFAGAGWAGDDPVFAGGVGVRYRIARRLGLDLGVDLAQGPEDTVLYIQFGRAWRRF